MATILSKSEIWQHLKNKFIQAGPSAWTSGGVPLSITCNPYLAKMTANIIHGHLTDQEPSADPIYILELAAGSGRFTYLVLKYLQELLKSYPLPGRKFCYIMSDISPASLEFWKSHPQLQEWIEEGILLPILFDPLFDKSLNVDLKHPLFVIANYFFDSIPHDLFKDGEIGKIDFHYNEDELQIDYEFEPFDKPYDNCLFNQVLSESAESCFYFPCGALECYENLLSIAKNGLIFLVADKAGYKNQKISTHGSYFFHPVNFLAINRYIFKRGGQAQHTSLKEDELVWHFGQIGCSQRSAMQAFQKANEPVTPLHQWRLANYFENDSLNPSIAYILLQLKLSHFDPSFFHLLFERLLKSLCIEYKEAILEMVEGAWNNLFVLCKEESFVVLELGQILMELKDYEGAIFFFDKAYQIYNHNLLACYNKALCYQALGKTDEAMQALEPAFQINPTIAAMQKEFILNVYPLIIQADCHQPTIHM